MKRLIFPLIFISEWILFFCVFLLVLAFNLINISNALFVDMSWEEPSIITASTASFIRLIALVFGLGIVCFLYTKHFTGEGLYKRIKSLAWGSLFAINSIGCFGYLLIWYKFNWFDLRNTELNLLLFIILVSVFLTIHISKKWNK